MADDTIDLRADVGNGLTVGYDAYQQAWLAQDSSATFSNPFDELFFDARKTVEQGARMIGSNRGYAAIASAGIAAVGSIFTGFQQARTQRIQLQMQQRVADYNARQAERAAQSALMASNAKIGAISEKFEKVKSSQKAAMAANGIMLGVGSAAEVTTSTDINKRRSIANQYQNGYEQANAYRMQGVNAQVQSAVSAVGQVDEWQGLSGAATAIGTGVKDYLYYNDKNKLRS